MKILREGGKVFSEFIIIVSRRGDAIAILCLSVIENLRARTKGTSRVRAWEEKRVTLSRSRRVFAFSSPSWLLKDRQRG